jgi:hypothetical protein
MEQYISKSAIMAEIRKYKNNAEAYLKYHHNRNDKSVYAFEQEKLVMCELLSSLDNLGAKEVNLDKEMNEALTHFTDKDMRGWFRYFFELGLKAQKGE